ncbi:MAG TPA: cation acetate symporter, partial [Spirillospora sp.]
PALRTSSRRVRTAGGISTITVSIFYLIAQMVGAGALVSLLFGFTSENARAATIVLVGILMVVYVAGGGMKGTTWVQIVKAALLTAGTTLLALLVLTWFGFDFSQMLREAADQSGKGDAFLEPGLRYATEEEGIVGKLDLISLGLALVLGTAGLPHVLIRFYTVPSAGEARGSVLWAIGIIGLFYLLTLVLGFGAAALVGSDEIARTNSAGNTAVPQLAEKVGELFFGDIGGIVLLAVISSVAIATILAVVAGLTLAAASSAAHDLYAHSGRRGQVNERDEVRFARAVALVIGIAAVVLGILAQRLNVAFLVALAFAMAASGNLPSILFSLFWRRFNAAGALASVYGGLGSAVLLTALSPVVSGSPQSLFTGVDFSYFPLNNPGLVSIPFGFLCGIVATLLSGDGDEAKFAEMEVRSLTGVGAERSAPRIPLPRHGRRARGRRARRDDGYSGPVYRFGHGDDGAW